MRVVSAETAMYGSSSEMYRNREGVERQRNRREHERRSDVEARNLVA